MTILLIDRSRKTESTIEVLIVADTLWIAGEDLRQDEQCDVQVSPVRSVRCQC